MTKLKTTLAAALVATLGFSTNAALAGDATTTINATAPNTCSVTGDVTSSGVGTVTGGTGSSGSEVSPIKVDFGSSLVDPVTALPLFSIDRRLVPTHTTKLNIPAQCNYANSVVSIKSQNGGMRLQDAPASMGDFNIAIGMLATVQRDTGGALKSTVAQYNFIRTPDEVKSGSVPSAWNGSLVVSLSPSGAYTSNGLSGALPTTSPSTTPMLAGTYSDVIQIRFGATSL